MFSPNELLHFAFADESDVYYCNELLALNLQQFLWLKLHEQGYGCVYYLESTDDGAVCVRTFGDRRARSYAPEKAKHKLFSKQKSRNDSLRRWLSKQLTEKDPDRAAIICPLKDFAQHFRTSDWEDFLRELAASDRRNGILILTAPPEVEASRSVFLTSPVFDYLREDGITALRTASLCDMYEMLHRSKPDRMVYLNAWTAERIHSLLSRMLVEDPKRTDDCSLRSEMEEYLLQWMNNPALRANEPRLANRLPSPFDLFRNAFDRLRREESWNQLTAKAGQVREAGGIRQYLEKLGCPYAEDPVNAVCVRRDADSWAGRCLHLNLRCADCGGEEQQKIAQMLDEIGQQVRAPQNREDNPRIAEAVGALLPELHAADLAGDVGTVRRILFSINFCIRWISVAPKSNEETAILTVLEKLQSYVTCSRLYFDRQRSYSMIRSAQAADKNRLTSLAMQQLENQAETARRVLSTYEDIVQASVVKLSAASAASDADLIRSLSEELNQQNEAAVNELSQDWSQFSERTNVLPPSTPAPPAPLPPTEDEEEYILTQDDYSIKPLSY